MNDIESRFRILFSQAKCEDTLLIMVRAKVREFKIRYDESLTSYRVAANEYRKYKRYAVVAMFNAAHERLLRIREKNRC
jgi:hypothetical protein